MKKFISSIVLLMLTLNIFSQDVETLSDSAQSCFMQTRYAEALNLYDSICSLGYSSSDLYYNMGNCYYRLNNIPYSIYYYEKSLLLDPSNNDAEFNLNIANRSLKQVVEVLPKPFYERWWSSLVHIMSADAWTIFSIIMLVLVLVGIGMYLFFGNIALRKTGFSIAVISLLALILSSICAYNATAAIKENNYAVVFEQTMVKSSPNADAVNSFEIYEGLTIQVVDSANGLYNIRLADGKEGWVDSNDVKMIAE